MVLSKETRSSGTPTTAEGAEDQDRGPVCLVVTRRWSSILVLYLLAYLWIFPMSNPTFTCHTTTVLMDILKEWRNFDYAGATFS